LYLFILNDSSLLHVSFFSIGLRLSWVISYVMVQLVYVFFLSNKWMTERRVCCLQVWR